MKRIIAVFLLCILLLCSCKADTKEKIEVSKTTAGVFVSFSEIDRMLTSENGFEKEFESMIKNLKDYNIKKLYFHVRSHCDSLFNSKYFPKKKSAEAYAFDLMEYVINECHKNNIELHAWINPYRVSSNTDVSLLDDNSPAKIWLNDQNSQNDINVCIYNGIYLNPAQVEVRRLIIDGVKEISASYEVDGICFDDYFYPTTDAQFDAESYDKYKSLGENPLPLDDWRRSNVNILVSGCYYSIKNINKNIQFSISPAASLEKNYTDLYADIEYWIVNGCLDTVIPQIYFGFDYPIDEYKFENLIERWKKASRLNENVRTEIALATYKIGTDLSPDNKEWGNIKDIIARQTEICYKDKDIDGYVFFSYSSLISENSLNLKQSENLKSIIKTYKSMEEN